MGEQMLVEEVELAMESVEVVGLELESVEVVL